MYIYNILKQLKQVSACFKYNSFFFQSVENGAIKIEIILSELLV